jgi:hypothetical protein
MSYVRAHTSVPAVLLLLGTLLLSAPAARALDAVSGQALADHCLADVKSNSEGFCIAYFAGVLDTLSTISRADGPATYCVPDDLAIESLIGLYLSESRLYPEVLETPANQLIYGMLLKFFPCRRA